jgi:hypothetical protein
LTMRKERPRIALLWHEAEDETKARRVRLGGVFQALEARGASAESIVYADETADVARERLLAVDGVLVWVNPITDGRPRVLLDALLREVATAGVWVSAHPDVVSTLGTKEVLYRTRTLGWGSDIRMYEDNTTFRSELRSRLSSGPIVLKRARGNGGLGVWKVELVSSDLAFSASSRLRVQHAYDSAIEEIAFDAFVERFAGYLGEGGRLVEQPFLNRVVEGMVRCYLSGSAVTGFAEHLARGLASATREAGSRLGLEKVMCGREAPAFRSLRYALESEWVPGMLQLLNLEAESLPAIWDADFLRGPKTPAGEDTWVLCEVNVSCVSPFPDAAAQAIAQIALARVGARRKRP